MKHDRHEKLFLPISFNSPVLEYYAKLFIKRFKVKLDNNKERFIVEIRYSQHVIGMFFKMVSVKESVEDIKWINNQNEAELLTFLSKIGTQEITNKLFVQKDIRGFDNNGTDFYIIKPNEQRLWHEAIGYIDVEEFADAIIKAGGNI